ncbi:hypothetical protein GCM10009595_12550 [Falsarthrobacter nasiphocae]
MVRMAVPTMVWSSEDKNMPAMRPMMTSMIWRCVMIGSWSEVWAAGAVAAAADAGRGSAEDTGVPRGSHGGIASRGRVIAAHGGEREEKSMPGVRAHAYQKAVNPVTPRATAEGRRAGGGKAM